MFLYPSLVWHRFAKWLIALCFALGVPLTARADDVAPELARLAATLRQLDALERMVEHSAAHAPVAPGERYHFDYSRLLADLALVRAGIQDHLTPSRAQPRDAAELTGDYRTKHVVASSPQASVEGMP